jgi:beta-glucosidase
VIRERAPGSQVGIVLNLTPAEPATDAPADHEAVREFDGLFNRWYLDPVFRGSYPEDAVADRVRHGHLAGPELPFVEPGDLDVIRTPLDFLGINYYSRVVFRGGADGKPEAVPQAPPEELTDMGWEVYPAGLTTLLERVHRDYAPARILVTENGCAYDDPPAPGDEENDARRVTYLEGHLAAVHAAIERGIPVEGYFLWSLLDNFEWAHGYAMRFGIVRVDFDTLARVPKRSAFWYRDVVSANVLDVPSADAQGESR